MTKDEPAGALIDKGDPAVSRLLQGDKIAAELNEGLLHHLRHRRYAGGKRGGGGRSGTDLFSKRYGFFATTFPFSQP